MTVLAYRDGVLAGDTMTTMSSEVKVMDDAKVGKHRGHLYGVSGDVCPTLKEFKAWFFPCLDAGKFTVMTGFDFDALVITPDGEIQIWSANGSCEYINRKFWAVGSGANVAMGAMAEGAPAIRAAKRAIEYHPGCGGHVRYKKLDNA